MERIKENNKRKEKSAVEHTKVFPDAVSKPANDVHDLVVRMTVRRAGGIGNYYRKNRMNTHCVLHSVCHYWAIIKCAHPTLYTSDTKATISDIRRLQVSGVCEQWYTIE